LWPVITSTPLAYAAADSAATNAALSRSIALTAPFRQLSAMDADIGSGKMSSSPFSTPSKMAGHQDGLVGDVHL